MLKMWWTKTGPKWEQFDLHAFEARDFLTNISVWLWEDFPDQKPQSKGKRLAVVTTQFPKFLQQNSAWKNGGLKTKSAKTFWESAK